MVKGFIFFRTGKIPFVIENYRMDLFTDDSLLEIFCKEYNFKENYILQGLCFDIGPHGRKATFLVENSMGSTCYLRCYIVYTFNKDETKDKLQHNNPFLFSVFYWMIFDNGFVKSADLVTKTMMGEKTSFWQKNFGEQIMRSLMLTSMDKATYTKGTWKAANNRVVKDVANSALQESKGRRGRKQVCVLLEEMLIQPHAEFLTNEIEKILTEWMETNDTDSILAYIFAALTNGSLLNDTYNYRTFHTAILEKFPSLGFKSGFDWGEALYNAIVSERGNDYNLSLSEKTVQTGKEQAKLISIRLRTLLSPDVY